MTNQMTSTVDLGQYRCVEQQINETNPWLMRRINPVFDDIDRAVHLNVYGTVRWARLEIFVAEVY